jgi:asparagine synthase (glutamine-hydrolysing)
VLSFAVEQTDKQISSYTVGFSGAGVADERPYARLAAEAFHTRHYDTTISATEFADFIPQYVWHMEEPVCEPPGIALHYITKAARRNVKVLLSGEGGDEAFAGYSNYRNLLWLERVKRGLGPLAQPANSGLSWASSVFDWRRMAVYAPLMSTAFPGYYFSRTSSSYSHSNDALGELYAPEFARTLDWQRTAQPFCELHSSVQGLHPLDAMLYIDTKTWLPDDLLVKADKMTMANSVELRVPLLDHKVLEFAAALPANLKVRGFTTKYLAKKALGRRVPPAILQRRKAGFPVPYESWLRKELRGWVREVLLDRATTNRGYFATSAVRALLARDEERGGYSKEIFSLLTLELWHRTFVEQTELVAG